MIGEGGSNPKTGNYSVTFEAVNEKGDVIQHLIEPRAFSVAPTPPPPPKPGVYKAPKKSGS
jgi:hypothetical protein